MLDCLTSWYKVTGAELIAKTREWKFTSAGLAPNDDDDTWELRDIDKELFKPVHMHLECWSHFLKCLNFF